MKMLNINNLTKEFYRGGLTNRSKIIALNNINLDLSPHRTSILSIVGESGSGKTTLAKILLRIIEPDKGSLEVLGENIFESRKIKTRKSFNKFIQPVFQNPFETFSSKKNVYTYLNNTAKYLLNDDTKNEESISKYLSLVGLDSAYIRNKKPYQFSGGELQRISIARALIAEPKIIIADEPVSMIDASLRMNIINLLLKIKNTLDIFFIYITHDLSTAYYISDYVAIMKKGEIIEFGERDILHSPQTQYTKLLIDSVPNLKRKWNFSAK